MEVLASSAFTGLPSWRRRVPKTDGLQLKSETLVNVCCLVRDVSLNWSSESQHRFSADVRPADCNVHSFDGTVSCNGSAVLFWNLCGVAGLGAMRFGVNQKPC